MRLTFFVTKKFPSWAENAAAMRLFVESGQLQLGNHTVSHPDLTKLSTGAIQAELTGCGDHANFDPVTHVFDQLMQLIRDRALQPVTPDDVFAR
jgi:hypothetical protein